MRFIELYYRKKLHGFIFIRLKESTVKRKIVSGRGEHVREFATQNIITADAVPIIIISINISAIFIFHFTSLWKQQQKNYGNADFITVALVPLFVSCVAPISLSMEKMKM